jgi:hypothetical protein
MFAPRPRGATLKRVQEALHNPHDSVERFDNEFPVSYRCPHCGVLGHGPRAQLQDAIREHRETCSARHVRADEPSVFQLLYPKQ